MTQDARLGEDMMGYVPLLLSEQERRSVATPEEFARKLSDGTVYASFLNCIPGHHGAVDMAKMKTGNVNPFQRIANQQAVIDAAMAMGVKVREINVAAADLATEEVKASTVSFLRQIVSFSTVSSLRKSARRNTALKSIAVLAQPVEEQKEEPKVDLLCADVLNEFLDKAGSSRRVDLQGDIVEQLSDCIIYATILSHISNSRLPQDMDSMTMEEAFQVVLHLTDGCGVRFFPQLEDLGIGDPRVHAAFIADIVDAYHRFEEEEGEEEGDDESNASEEQQEVEAHTETELEPEKDAAVIPDLIQEPVPVEPAEPEAVEASCPEEVLVDVEAIQEPEIPEVEHSSMPISENVAATSTDPAVPHAHNEEEVPFDPIKEVLVQRKKKESNADAVPYDIPDSEKRWVMLKSEDLGRSYYTCEQTGEVTFFRPKGFKPKRNRTVTR